MEYKVIFTIHFTIRDCYNPNEFLAGDDHV